MKNCRLILALPSLTFLSVLSVLSHGYGENITAENLTISQSAAFGTIYTSGPPTMTIPGLRISVGQTSSSQSIVRSYEVLPEPRYEEVTIEDSAWVAEGYYQDNYQWGIVSSSWIEPVTEDRGSYQSGALVWSPNVVEVTAGYFDENNNWVSPVYEDQGSWTAGDPVWVPNIVEITPGYWQDMWGDVFTGQTWIGTGGHTEIVGTHTELQSVQDPSFWTSEQIDYIAGGPPRIEFASTRSDANFVWQIPENDSAESPLRDVLVVSNGGLTIPSADSARQTHLYPTGLQQSKQESFTTGSRTYSAESCAEVTKHTMSWVLNDGQYKTERSELLPGYLRFTKTEQVSAEGSLNTVTTRTSIAPSSAQFGGVVTVEGNLRVHGALRVMPAGGLSMGEFTNGPTPTGN